MKHRLRDVIDSLDHSELIKIRNDLETGGVHLQNFVKKKILEREKEHENYCSVCQGKLEPSSTSNFTLVFGPSDLKKKASFCAIDCLNYFLRQLEEIKKTNRVSAVNGNGNESSNENSDHNNHMGWRGA